MCMQLSGDGFASMRAAVTPFVQPACRFAASLALAAFATDDDDDDATLRCEVIPFEGCVVACAFLITYVGSTTVCARSQVPYRSFVGPVFVDAVLLERTSTVIVTRRQQVR